MSGIFGIYHPGNRPINPSHSQGMADGSAHRGPDGTKIITKPHIAFGHSMLHTTPESLSEILPHTDLKSGIIITSDARIDNREELFNKLGSQQKASIPDSQLILQTYKQWGVDSFSYLLGDFAFVLWDPAKQQLVCARDYIGVKPFYYHSTRSQFLFSSEIKQLAEHPDVTLQPNEGIIAEYLNASLCDQTETLYENLFRLAPGHYLIITAEGLFSKQFWEPSSIQSIRYKHSTEYTEHFLEIFRKAVKSRIRGNTSISAELSGGLDSSVVLGMACDLCYSQNKPCPTPYSMIFAEHPFDESFYIKAAAKHCGTPVQFIQSQNYTCPDWESQVKNSFELPDVPNLSMRDELAQEVSNSQARILLSGIGGDEWFTGANYPYLDLILDRKYACLFKETKNSFSRNTPIAIKQMLLSLSWPLAPFFLKKILCKQSNNRFPEWLPKTFLSTTNLLQRIQDSDPRTFLSNLGSLFSQDVISTGFENYFLESLDRYHAPLHIEYRMPFLDKRIAEFSLAIPVYEFHHCGKNKTLLRNSTNRFLPKLIRKRYDKAEFSFFLSQAFNTPKFNAAINSLLIEQKHWIDRASFQKNFHARKQCYNSDSYDRCGMYWETWFTGAIEIWFQILFAKQ